MGAIQFGLENQIDYKKRQLYFIIIFMIENMMKKELLIPMKVRF